MTGVDEELRGVSGRESEDREQIENRDERIKTLEGSRSNSE